METASSLPRAFPAAEIAEATGAEPVHRQAVAGGGYGRNTLRWRVRLGDGRLAFVKMALDPLAAEWLRAEHLVYSSVEGPFMPEFLGWHDDRETLLVIEDLGDALWPPPWTPELITAVCESLDAVHATQPPGGLRGLEELREGLDGWPDIAADPEPLLSTGLCTRRWLEEALPAFRQASAACVLAGDSFLHGDVRSDNLCFQDGRPVFVDWNHACVGTPLLDVVAWLPSLRLEQGPEPWEIVADSGGLAPLIAGFFASRAGLPPARTAPTVREFQRRQAAIALRWAARELAMPPPEEP